MNLLKSAATALLLALTTLVCAAPAAAQTVEYVHTDALGSVVAVTDANRNIVERREYEPYGYQLTPTLQNGPGYTGHVQDASTGLTYMQQRYYDPLLGRFLSVDPVTMHDNGDPRLFNRYGYAANNPYTFVDPDGRIFGVLGKVVKLAIKGGDVAATVAGAVEDAGVLFGSDATAGERLAEAASLATEVLSPVSARDAKAIVGAVGGRKSGPSAPEEMLNSPTSGKKGDSETREWILQRDQNSDGSWTCATCGQSTSNPDNIHVGHKVPRSNGGDLSDGNLRCEGAACNLSQGNMDKPKTGMTCAERGSCGAPYGRND